MKQYIKDGQIKTRNQIIIKGQHTVKDKEGNDKIISTDIYNPTEETVLANGWVEYISPIPDEPTEEDLLNRAKESALRRLEEFDAGNTVNDCIIIKNGQTMHYWADKTDRDALKGALRDCILTGRTEYRLDLRELGIYLYIPCESLLQMLSSLEVYAIDCYNKTTDHVFAIKSLDSIHDVEMYDFTVGYPEKLTFEL